MSRALTTNHFHNAPKLRDAARKCGQPIVCSQEIWRWPTAPTGGLPSLLMFSPARTTDLPITTAMRVPNEAQLLENPVFGGAHRVNAAHGKHRIARGYSRIHSAPHRGPPGGFRRGSGHLAALSLIRVGTLWCKTRAQCGVHQSIEFPR
jgi:hypothetical protein